MRYLLDTNIFIGAMKGREPIRKKLTETPLIAILLSPVVLGELELGVEKSSYQESNRVRLAKIIEQIELAPIDAAVSRAYAHLRATLESQGKPIGANDYWIAAQGLALGAVVVTDNEREFSRVENLQIENWLRI
jgi:tRNA(fMet)-specific endonuclease VapC